jgi:hypothetical protein
MDLSKLKGYERRVKIIITGIMVEIDNFFRLEIIFCS